jgi:uncharacterized protein
MSEHLSTLASVYEAFGRGDVPAILEHLADDVRWEEWADNRAQKAGVPWLLARRGKEGAAEFFRSLGAMTITDFQVLSLLSGGNQVAAEVDLTIEIGGKKLREEEMHLWTFDTAGKVIRFRHYADTAKHIEAAGL